MKKQHFTIKNSAQHWRFILTMTIIFALVAFIVSTLMPAKYQSDISVIVVQEQASDKVDAFSATKSAEFLSNIFSRVIYTTSFFDAVQDAPFAISHNFSRDPEEREKEWKKMVSVKKVNNTGIINISVFNESRKTAEETAKAIAYILTTKGGEYHGGGNRVSVRLIDGPNTPLKPTMPRILPNTIIGAFFGFIVALLIIYFFPEKFMQTHKRYDDKEFEEDEVFLSADDSFEHVNVVDDHFKNAHQTVIDDKENIPEEKKENEKQNTDPAVEAIHAEISAFHQKTQK